MDFRSRCGDRYVAGLLYGGTLMANVTAQTESEDETKKIQAAMQLSVGPFGADAKVKEETTRALQSVRYTVTGFISGGAARQLGTTIDDLNARLQSFVQEVHQSGGAEVFALLSDYSGITAVDVPQAASTTIEHIANMYWDLTSVLHELDYIDAHPQQYNMDLSGWRPHLQALRKSATASQDQLLKAASTCRESLERCAIPTTTDASSIRAQYPLRYRGVCDRVLFDPPNIAVYPLEHTGGDADIDGHNPKIEVEVGVSVDDNGYTINATTDVNIRETGGDQTEYHGKNKTQLINLMVDHPNCFVEATGVNPSAGALTAWGGPNNHGEDDYSGGTGLLAEAQCRSDTNGEDTGKLGCRYISLRPMTLLLRHDEERLDDGSRRLRLLEQQGLVTSGSDKARRRALSDSTQLRAWAMRAAANQGASEVLSQLRGGGSIRRGPTSPRVSDLAIPRFEQPVIPGSH